MKKISYWTLCVFFYLIGLQMTLAQTQKMELPDGVFETHDHYRFDRFKPAPLIRSLRKEKEISLYGGSPYLFQVDYETIKKQQLDDFVATVNIVWGYVYRGDLYVTDKVVTSRTGTGYAKIILLGRYSLFPLRISALHQESKETTHLLQQFDEGYILDIKTSKVVSFSVKQLKKLLKEHAPTLGTQYDSEADQEAKRVDYLIQLNQLLNENE